MQDKQVLREYIVGIGSNLGEKDTIIKEALHRIETMYGHTLASSSITTEPWGFESDNEFTNLVAAFSTMIHPETVLESLLEIENELGRKRSSRGYTDRTLDLDIIAIDQGVYHSEKLTVPHPLMHEREFVLVPMCEIRPKWTHPLLGKTSEILLEETQNNK